MTLTVGLLVAVLLVQLATLMALLRPRSEPVALPSCVDVSAPGRQPVPGTDVVVAAEAPDGGSVAVAIEGRAAVLYDVWARTESGWVQLVPVGQGAWASRLLTQPPSALRVWLSAAGRPVDPGPSLAAAGMLVQAVHLLSDVHAGRRAWSEPPALDRNDAVAVLRRRAGADPVARAALEGWTDACIAAGRVGWVLGLPAGDLLVDDWARQVEGVVAEPAVAFARWLVGGLGKAARSGLVDRRTAELREAPARRLYGAAAQLVRVLQEDLDVVVDAPAGVGEPQRRSWTVDERVAARLGNAVVRGAVQPVFVLRPLLKRGEVVLLEGEVA